MPKSEQRATAGRREWLATLASSVAVAGVVAVLVAATGARAEGEADPVAPPELVPYRGALFQDGEPVDGPVSVVFRLFDGPEAEPPLWEETHEAVQVYRGRFLALLGGTSADSALALAAAVRAAGETWLSVALLVPGAPEEPPAEVPLTNRQPLRPVLHTLQPWGTATSDYHTEGALTVGGSAATGGDLTVTGVVTTAGGATLALSERVCTNEYTCTCADDGPEVISASVTCPAGRALRASHGFRNTGDASRWSATCRDLDCVGGGGSSAGSCSVPPTQIRVLCARIR